MRLEFTADQSVAQLWVRYVVVVRLILCAVLLSSFSLLQAQGKDDILVNFAGILKSVTNKAIVIEPEDGNDMRFIRTRRTRFLNAKDKAVSELDFRPGDAVAVEAFQKLNTELEAVNVRHSLKPDPADR